MTSAVVIRVRDLRTYLDRFPDEAVVLREIGDASLEGAYVDLNVAMQHLEQEHGDDEIASGDGDDEDDERIDAEDEDGDDYDPEAELQDARDLTRGQERSIGAWEKAQS